MRAIRPRSRYRLALAAAMLVVTQTVTAQDGGGTNTTRMQPIHISAGRIELDQKKSVTYYRGKVTFRQGGMKISADMAEARYRGERIESIVATGNPVRLVRHIPEQGDRLEATTRKLDYNATDNAITLQGEVRLTQETGAASARDSLRITADTVEARYQGDRIESLVATGNPVDLQRSAAEPGDNLQGSTQRLEYHATANRLDLRGQVVLKQDINTIRGPVLHYNLAEGTVTAEGDESGGRIDVVIEPKQPEVPAPGNPRQLQNKGQP